MSMNKEIRKIVNAAIKGSMVEYISLKKTASGENYFKIGFKDTPPDLIFNFWDRKQLSILEIVNEPPDRTPDVGQHLEVQSRE